MNSAENWNEISFGITNEILRENDGKRQPNERFMWEDQRTKLFDCTIRN